MITNNHKHLHRHNSNNNNNNNNKITMYHHQQKDSVPIFQMGKYPKLPSPVFSQATLDYQRLDPYKQNQFPRSVSSFSSLLGPSGTLLQLPNRAFSERSNSINYSGLPPFPPQHLGSSNSIGHLPSITQTSPHQQPHPLHHQNHIQDPIILIIVLIYLILLLLQQRPCIIVWKNPHEDLPSITSTFTSSLLWISTSTSSTTYASSTRIWVPTTTAASRNSWWTTPSTTSRTTISLWSSTSGSSTTYEPSI